LAITLLYSKNRGGTLTMTLEGEEPTVEGAEPTLEEGGKPTLPEEKPTVGVTETEEFRKALDKALGKGLESTNRQLSLSKAEANTAKAEVEAHKADMQAIEAELRDLQRQHDDLVGKQFADDPEARQAYVDRRAIADDRRKLAKEKATIEAKLYEAEKLAWSVGMARKADTLVKETGIDASELEACQTEEEMEVKALRFHLAKGSKEEKTPKFDSGVSSGVGVDLEGLSPRQLIQHGIDKERKK